MMTYVSYFPEAKPKPGAPLKQKMNDASKCSASGPGLQEHGVVVSKPADFTVFTSGSSRGKLNVQVYGPGRKLIDCMVQDNHDNTYSCQYVAPKMGELNSIFFHVCILKFCCNRCNCLLVPCVPCFFFLQNLSLWSI